MQKDNGKSGTQPISRTKLELFLECPRCFYQDRVHGVVRPDHHVYTLNLAVDALLKNEFDLYRNLGDPHPLMLEAGIDAVPFFHPSLCDWREATRGIRAGHVGSGFTLFGAVDDVWKASNGDLIVVDYKCTGRMAPTSNTLRPSYGRQVEVYQWILRQMGFAVSRTAYFVFAAADRSREVFGGSLHFAMSVVPYRGNNDWVHDALLEARHCLDRTTLPPAAPECPWCAFVASSSPS